MPAATCCRTCGGWVVIRGRAAEARPADEDPSPGLKALATGILQAEAAYLEVSLNAADVLPRRAEGVPAVHLAEAADQLLGHLAAIEGTILPDQGILAVLARAGAQLLVSGIELDGPTTPPSGSGGQVSEVSSSPAWRRFSRSYVSRARLTAAQAGSPSAVGSDGGRPLSPLPHGGPGRPWPG